MSNQKAKSQKLFSIIMATYNCGQKVENTLESIFSQNPDLFEVIVLDGGSTDETQSYVEKYATRLTFISEKDDGIYHAFNKGIELTTGKYLYFIGAGDCLKKGILDEVKQFLPMDKPSLIYGKCQFPNQDKYYNREFTARSFIRNCLCQQGIFYHRDTFEIVGKYELRYKVFADWFFNINCFLNDRINKQYINYVIAEYEGGGISTNIDNDLIFKKEFPVFVRKEFGWTDSIICELYLKDPILFQSFYAKELKYLPEHFKQKYSLLRKIATRLKPLKNKYKSLSKLRNAGVGME
jgi:glycosyltransferase involved in cell wall biosynthesis